MKDNVKNYAVGKKKYLRLKKNTDFQRLFKKGERVYSQGLTILYRPSQQTVMGIALSKKHGKAVRRNRIKRLIRAAFIKNLNVLNEPCSMVILPKVQDDYNYKDIEKSLIACLKRINSCHN